MSCATKTILIKTVTFKSKVMELQNPGLNEQLWQDAINYECGSQDKPDSRNANVSEVYRPLRLVQRLLAKNRLSSTLVEKMLNVKFTEKHLKSEEAETYLSGKDLPCQHFPEFCYFMGSDTMLLIEKDAVQHKECVQREDGSYKIELSLQIVVTEEREIWKCEDIGATMHRDLYEFYYIPHHWMTTDTNNKNWYINEAECSYNLSVCNDHVAQEVTCSVNNVEKCGKVMMSRSLIEPNRSSHVRNLAGGVAVYGTFHEMIEFPEDHDPAVTEQKWGLYYFSFSE